jgi:hypothetical protein
MPFDMTPIEGSTNLRAHGYDPATETLRVEFNGGNQYDYHGVTEDLFNAFVDAPSQGSFLHSVIKIGCPASKVEKEA